MVLCAVIVFSRCAIQTSYGQRADANGNKEKRAGKKTGRLANSNPPSDIERSKKVASWCALNPAVTVSTTIQRFGKQQFEDVDFSELTSETKRHLKAIEGGDMSGVEAMLYGQAVALQSIFMNLVHRAHGQTNLVMNGLPQPKKTGTVPRRHQQKD
jgi:hypothetical protein